MEEFKHITTVLASIVYTASDRVVPAAAAYLAEIWQTNGVLR